MVFNTNISSISVISLSEQILLFHVDCDQKLLYNISTCHDFIDRLKWCSLLLYNKRVLTCFKRSSLKQRKSVLIRQVTSYKEVQFIWIFLWQDKKNGVFKYRRLLNRGDCVDRFNCIHEIDEFCPLKNIYSTHNIK